MVKVSETCFVQDYSAAFFMIEELVSAGASRIATDNDIFTTLPALDRIPDLLRKRIEIVESSESFRMTLAIMKPVLDELGLEPLGPDGLRGVAPSHSGSLPEHAAELYFAIPDFILACREQLQLDFPLKRVRDSIAVLLSGIRGQEGRAALATLAGVFASYRPAAVDSPEVRSTMSGPSATLLMDLLEDEVFRDLSRSGWFMGIPGKTEQAIVNFGRCARRIVNSSLFKPLMNLISKGISTTTHLPTPTPRSALL